MGRKTERNMITQRMLSIPETAQYLGLAEKTIRNRCGRGAKNPFPIRAKRIGRRVLFDMNDLNAYLAGLSTT